jgi:hypothetical protein
MRRFKALFRPDIFTGVDFNAKFVTMSFGVDECWYDGFERMMAVAAEGKRRFGPEEGSAGECLSPFVDSYVALVIRRAIVQSQASDDTDLAQKKDFKDKLINHPEDYDTPTKIRAALLEAHGRGLFQNGRSFRSSRTPAAVVFAVQSPTRGQKHQNNNANKAAQPKHPKKPNGPAAAAAAPVAAAAAAPAAAAAAAAAASTAAKASSSQPMTSQEAIRVSHAVKKAVQASFSGEWHDHLESIKSPFGGSFPLYRVKLGADGKPIMSSEFVDRCLVDENFRKLMLLSREDARFRDAQRNHRGFVNAVQSKPAAGAAAAAPEADAMVAMLTKMLDERLGPRDDDSE